MNKQLLFLFVLGLCWLQCFGREPLRPLENSIPFMVHFESRYRGICVGVLVSRLVVLTAAVCVTNPKFPIPHDNRPLNIIAGSAYRHTRRGIRIQVSKIILPKLPEVQGERGYLLQKSVALLILKRKVPDILTEIPMRAVEVDFLGEDRLKLQDECIMIGWHFFYKGEPIWPGNKFLLQRNMRYQLLNLVKKSEYCDTLRLKFETAMDELGFTGLFSKSDLMCVRDGPCSRDYMDIFRHNIAYQGLSQTELRNPVTYTPQGMYGSPLICGSGRVVAMMMAPDAQWTNCTGYSNIVHTFNAMLMKDFFSCTKKLFEPETRVNWQVLKHAHSMEFNEEEYIIKNMYDGVITDFESTSSEYE